MTMIGPDELGELDDRVRTLFQTLIQQKKIGEVDQQAAGRLLDWVIYPDWDTPEELDIRPIQWSGGLAPQQREMLIQISRSAAALAKSGKDRHKAELIEQCEMLLRSRGVTFGDAAGEARPQRVDARTDARDKFIYQKVCKGSPAKKIRDLIDQHPDWDLIPEAQIAACAVRYAQRHGLPLPQA